MAIVNVWAPPGTWGLYANLRAHSGGPRTYTVNFTTESQAPSSFTAEIQYVDSNGVVTAQALAAGGSSQASGSYTIRSSGGAGTDRIRFRSHSLGQNIRVTY